MKNPGVSIAIIEDELHSRAFLKRILEEHFPDLHLVGEAESVSDAIELIDTAQPDILLLDVQLKDGNSFRIFDQIKHTQYQLVFITSYDDYAIKAIKLSAVDYILKPIHIPEFKQAIERAIERNSENSHRMLKEGDLQNEHQSITLLHNRRYAQISFDDIYALIAEDSYTRIHLHDESIISTKPLRYYEDILPSDFFRSHRSTILNCAKVAQLDMGRGGNCMMSNGLVIPVSVRRKAELRTMLST